MCYDTGTKQHSEDKYMNTKEEFNKLLKKQGYESLYEFCMKNQIDYSNMSKRVGGVRQKIEISFMFRIANMLHVPVETIIEIFYYDDWITNRAMLNERDFTM